MSATRVYREISQMNDVAISSPADGQVLAYQASSGKFINESAIGGGLSSATGSGALTLTLAGSALTGSVSAATNTSAGTMSAPNYLQLQANTAAIAVLGSAVAIRHADGTVSAFSTPNTALAASVAGDTICVCASFTVTGNLRKNGVDWYLPFGVTLTQADNKAGYMFDDLGVACNSNVWGRGICNRVVTGDDGSISSGGNNSTGVFNQTNANSNTYQECQANFSLSVATWYQSAVKSSAGTFRFRGTITNLVQNNNNTIWWDNGLMILQMDQVIGGDSSAASIYLASTDHTQGDFYLDVENIGSPFGSNNSNVEGGCINMSCTDPASAAWINAGTIYAGNGNGEGITNAGGKLYVNAQKIFGAMAFSCLGSIANAGTSSQSYITAQKVGGYQSSITATGSPGLSTYVNLNIGEFDPADAATIPYFIDSEAGATVELNGGRWTPFAGNSGIKAGGGSGAGAAGGTVSVLSGSLINSGGTDVTAGSGSSGGLGGTVNLAAGVAFKPGSVSTSGTATVNIINGGAAIPLPRRVTTNFAKAANTTLGNITGLTFNVVASGVYTFLAKLYVTTDATGGHKYAIAGTCTATSIVYQVDSQGPTSIASGQASALATSVSGPSGGTTGYTQITGTIVVNATGTLTVQFAQNSASGTSTVLAGSTFEMKQIG